MSSKRESRENELIDVFLRAKLSDALNVRSELMRLERIKYPEAGLKTLQRRVNKSLVLKDKLSSIQQEWYQFCLKPKKRGVLGIANWKKVTPNREAYKMNLDAVMGDFDKQEKQMFKDQGAITPSWYKVIINFVVNLFRG